MLARLDDAHIIRQGNQLLRRTAPGEHQLRVRRFLPHCAQHIRQRQHPGVHRAQHLVQYHKVILRHVCRRTGKRVRLAGAAFRFFRFCHRPGEFFPFHRAVKLHAKRSQALCLAGFCTL